MGGKSKDVGGGRQNPRFGAIGFLVRRWMPLPKMGDNKKETEI